MKADSGASSTDASSTAGAAPSSPGAADDAAAPDETAPGEGFKPFSQYFRELSAYGSYWAAAKRDQMRLLGQKIAIYAVLGILGTLCLATALIVAVVMLLTSLGGWLGHGFSLITPGLYFLGPLLVALLVLGGSALAIRIGVSKALGTSRKRTEMKYERKRLRQRARFGHDVRDRSRQQKRREAEKAAEHPPR